MSQKCCPRRLQHLTLRVPAAGSHCMAIYGHVKIYSLRIFNGFAHSANLDRLRQFAPEGTDIGTSTLWFAPYCRIDIILHIISLWLKPHSWCIRFRDVLSFVPICFLWFGSARVKTYKGYEPWENPNLCDTIGAMLMFPCDMLKSKRPNVFLEVDSPPQPWYILLEERSFASPISR